MVNSARIEEDKTAAGGLMEQFDYGQGQPLQRKRSPRWPWFVKSTRYPLEDYYIEGH